MPAPFAMTDMGLALSRMLFLRGSASGKLIH